MINELDVETIIESEYPDVAVLMNECLSFCGLCAIKPYAIVNGARIFGKTSEEALDKIRKKIEEELALFAE
ncbi:YuzB family protein [Halobacillus shinanisalinarum]|uniref:YuzB family protein n=1 Tax=Halobacillus shinanisalinarum TaxID=2932258 RepID=A0ABY4GUH7_9BACI|nr:YuzB family protein [Halobacillus shinanisalinarum]